MSFINKLLNGIGDFFTGLFNAAKRSYNQLPEATQQALVHGSGIIEIINNNLAASPAFVRELIKKQFPDIDEAKLEDALFEVAHGFNLVPKSKNFDDVMASIQTYFSGITGKTWATVSHAGASLLSVLFAPPATKVAAVVSLMEYVYHAFIKKS